MISSSPAFLKCHECKKSPKQFTFLLCNHIICEKCISKNIEFGDRHNTVMCSCGSLTYFNEESEIIDQQEIEVKNVEKQRKQFLTRVGFENVERRSMIDQRNSFSKNLSKETIDQYSKTLINERSTMPMLEVSQVFSLQKNDSSQQNKKYRLSSPQKHRYLQGSLLTTEMRNNLSGTDKTRYDESFLLDNYQCYEPVGRREKQPMRTINQFSTHQIGSSAKDKPKNTIYFSPKNILNEVKNIRQSVIVDGVNNDKNRVNGLVKNVKQNLFQTKLTNQNISSPTTKTSHHCQFQSQLSFLKIMFQKDVQEIQFQFKKVIDHIIKDYNSLEEELRSLYVEQVITKQSLLGLNLSSLVKSKYDRKVGDKFRMLKDQLFLPFYSSENKHNQNALFQNKTKVKNNKGIQSPLLQAYKQQYKNKPSKMNNSLNQSQVIQDSQNDEDNSDYAEEITTMNHRKKVPQFDVIQEKLQRLTAKSRKTKPKRTDHVKVYNDESSKRIQTQNIHASIKRNQSHSNLNQNRQNKQRTSHINNTFQSPPFSQHQTYHASPQYRLTQKPNPKKTHLLQTQQQKRRQIVYYSPPIPYCYKHLQKKQKQARDYISYIDKLCHEKKMKNNHELFKKVKTGYEFVGRNCDRQQ